MAVALQDWNADAAKGGKAGEWVGFRSSSWHSWTNDTNAKMKRRQLTLIRHEIGLAKRCVSKSLRVPVLVHLFFDFRLAWSWNLEIVICLDHYSVFFRVIQWRTWTATFGRIAGSDVWSKMTSWPIPIQAASGTGKTKRNRNRNRNTNKKRTFCAGEKYPSVTSFARQLYLVVVLVLAFLQQPVASQTTCGQDGQKCTMLGYDGRCFDGQCVSRDIS